MKKIQRSPEDEHSEKMLRLLLATDKAEVRQLYASYPDWESQGFALPTIVPTADEAVAALGRGRYDAVSWLLPQETGRILFDATRNADIVGMEPVRSVSRLRREIASARREIMSRRRSAARQDFDEIFLIMRREFIRDLLRGSSYDADAMNERAAHLFIPRERLSSPVAAASMRLPEGDAFALSRWKYGEERLENAMRNVFEPEKDGLRFILLMLNAHHLRLLCLPESDTKQEDLFCAMLRRVRIARRSLAQAFDMPLVLRWINTYDNLYVFARSNAARSAH